MAEMVDIYEPGDRFGTISSSGLVRVWEVADDGTLADDSSLEHTAHKLTPKGGEST